MKNIINDEISKLFLIKEEEMNKDLEIDRYAKELMESGKPLPLSIYKKISNDLKYDYAMNYALNAMLRDESFFTLPHLLASPDIVVNHLIDSLTNMKGAFDENTKVNPKLLAYAIQKNDVEVRSFNRLFGESDSIMSGVYKGKPYSIDVYGHIRGL